MKFLIAFLLVVSSSIVKAESGLDCFFNQSNRFVALDSEENTGVISFNYTTARVVCPQFLNTVIESKEDFQCVGLWDVDYLQTDLPGKNTAFLNFKHDGEKYIATFKTSSVHNNKKISVSCTR